MSRIAACPQEITRGLSGRLSALWGGDGGVGGGGGEGKARYPGRVKSDSRPLRLNVYYYSLFFSFSFFLHFLSSCFDRLALVMCCASTAQKPRD